MNSYKVIFAYFLFNFKFSMSISGNSDMHTVLDTDIIKEKLFEDAFLSTPKLIAKYGYPVEIHSIETADKYLLQVYRIPKPGGIPVLFMHGIFDSSDGAVVLGPKKSIGYILHDAGYDVWLGNARGTPYSKKNKVLETDNDEFWNFSFHEIGVYDIPAVINHILRETGYQKLHYIGFSQGTTSFFAMCSERPNYCDKIILMTAIAPVTFLGNTEIALIQAFALMMLKNKHFMEVMGVGEFGPGSDVFKLAGQFACRDEAITQVLCSTFLRMAAGFNSKKVNSTSLPVLFGHMASVSTKQLYHYGQLVNSRKFRLFDFGKAENVRRYGTPEPPSYNLTRVTAPVVIFYSNDDWLTVPTDVRHLAHQLPNLQKMYLVPNFSHMDFMYAMDAKNMLFDKIIIEMRKAERKMY